MIFSTSRTLVLIGSVIVTLGSGTNYGYSAYAPQLGDALHITHTQLNIIGLAGNMGVYLTSPFIGRIVDFKGPRILFLVSFFLLLGGYAGIKWFYDRATTPSTIGFIILVLASFATGVGGNCGNTAAMNTTAKSFPDRMRATTTSTVAAGYGLSAFFFATIAHTIFPGNTSGFLLVLSIGTALPMLVGLALVKVTPHTDAIAIPAHSQTRYSIEVVPAHDERRRSENWDVYTPVVGPGVYERLTESDLEDELREANVATPFLRHNSRERSDTADAEVELSPSRRQSIALPHPETRVHRHSRSRSRSLVKPHEHTDVHGWALLQDSEFWILFLIMCCLSGTGLMYLNNCGSIAQALFARGDPQFDTVESAQWQAAQVSITSITNCLGRVIFGSAADFAKNHYDWRRSYFVSMISFAFIISQVVLYYTSSVQTLWIASATLGFGYGGMFGLFPTLMIEWFGLAHFSQNWGFLCISPVIAGNLFSLAFGSNLDAHSRPPEDVVPPLWRRGGLPISDDDRQCLEGRLCYSESITLTIAACMVAFVLSVIAGYRDHRKHDLGAGVEHPRRDVIWDGEEEAT